MYLFYVMQICMLFSLPIAQEFGVRIADVFWTTVSGEM